jgi:hypothetical protein
MDVLWLLDSKLGTAIRRLAQTGGGGGSADAAASAGREQVQ